MKVLFQFFGVLIFGAILVSGFQNCSQARFSSTTDASSVGKTGDPDPGGPGTPVTEVIADCNAAIMNNTLQIATQSVAFEDTKTESGRSQVCQFGVGDNLSMLDGHLRARYEQNYKLQLPANAVICDIQMIVPQQTINYDDIFFFTYNGRILASDDHSAMSGLTPEASYRLQNGSNVDIYKYDWLGVRNQSFQNERRDDYCLGQGEGAGSCTWPLTQQTGNIQFSFDQELLILLSQKADVTNQNFGLVITGDNDPNVDCYHSRLEFSMQVKYYLK